MFNECELVCGIKIGKANPSIWRKPDPIPLSLPQIPIMESLLQTGSCILIGGFTLSE
jgi:hypothetical protein